MKEGDIKRGKLLEQLVTAIRCIARPQGATVRELAEALEVGERQARRMLQTMQDLRFPLVDTQRDASREKRWQFMPEYVAKLSPDLLLPSLLTLEEVLALTAAAKTTPIASMRIWCGHLDSALEKIGGVLPKGFGVPFSKMLQLVEMLNKCSKDYSDKASIIDGLFHALLQQRTCHIDYASFSKGREVSFRINPLHAFAHAGGLYCLVQSPEHGDIRVVAVERIVSITLEAAQFMPPADFDPHAMLDGAFGVVWGEPFTLCLKVSAEQAPYIKERRWSSKQSITEAPDGSIILEMETSGEFEVKRWILGLGAAAEVLAPEWMREEVRGEAVRLLEQYARSC